MNAANYRTKHSIRRLFRLNVPIIVITTPNTQLHTPTSDLALCRFVDSFIHLTWMLNKTRIEARMFRQQQQLQTVHTIFCVIGDLKMQNYRYNCIFVTCLCIKMDIKTIINPTKKMNAHEKNERHCNEFTQMKRYYKHWAQTNRRGPWMACYVAIAVCGVYTSLNFQTAQITIQIQFNYINAHKSNIFFYLPRSIYSFLLGYLGIWQ